MESQENHIIVEKRARFHTLGEAKESVKHVWVVCHGYGQLSKFFIQKFKSLVDDENIVIAPEGFSKFYLKGYNGRVGASWMTTDNRENDIKDYVGFLNQLYDHIISTYGNVQIHVIGFSQAAATVCRWINDGKAPVSSLILWSGMFPPDLDFRVAKEIYQQMNVKWLVGDQDEFMSIMNIEEHHAVLKNHEIDFEYQLFKGKHDIYPEVLKDLKAFI